MDRDREVNSMSGKKIYIVVEFIREKLPGQQFPEVTGIKAYKAYTDKRAAETELLRHNPFTTKIITTTLQEG